jgi:peroxiredoxin
VKSFIYQAALLSLTLMLSCTSNRDKPSAGGQQVATNNPSFTAPNTNPDATQIPGVTQTPGVTNPTQDPSIGATIQPLITNPGTPNTPGAPALTPGTSTWSGAGASRDFQVQIARTGQTASLSSLQRSRAFLVVGFYESNCPLCQTKADAFSQAAARNMLVGSSKCSYVGVVKDTVAEYQQKAGFIENFAVAAPSSTLSAFLGSVFTGGLVYPATVVFDSEGNVVNSAHSDFGPQTALSYCI